MDYFTKILSSSTTLLFANRTVGAYSYTPLQKAKMYCIGNGSHSYLFDVYLQRRFA
jgi:hypothetical protein